MSRLDRTTSSNSRCGHCVNVLGQVAAWIDIFKTGRGRGLQFEGTNQERRHLTTRHRPVRAIAQRLSSAALGDLKLCKSLRVRRPSLAGVDVIETRCADAVGVVSVEHANQPHRHLPAQQRLTWTQVGSVIAAGSVEHALSAQSVNRFLVNPGVLFGSHRARCVGHSDRDQRCHQRPRRSAHTGNHKKQYITDTPEIQLGEWREGTSPLPC